MLNQRGGKTSSQAETQSMKLAHGKMCRSQAVGKDSPTPAIQGATERILRESAEVKSEPVHLAGLGEV